VGIILYNSLGARSDILLGVREAGIGNNQDSHDLFICELHGHVKKNVGRGACAYIYKEEENTKGAAVWFKTIIL